MPSAGGFSQTMVNVNAGARSQLSGLVTAGLAVGVALFLAPVLSDLPQATLAAIVVAAIVGLIDIGALHRIGRIDPAELVVATLTALAALATNLLVGVLVGVLLTFYLVLRRLNHPTIVELRRTPGNADLEPARPGDEVVPGLLVLRIEGGLYTMNVRAVQATIIERVDALDPPPRDAGRTHTHLRDALTAYEHLSTQDGQ
ncbi:hypothetical protein GCM10009804_58360 [Kribbella hippodromi]|uniref:SLC26A/SulP transporter domain-containing protein n=1 Tax=Kribbella hippodromi TaxID=434347 RepID=A0ABN2E4T4_9ACTN